MEKEEWKNIEGFDGYQISNRGNVRSLDRVLLRRNRDVFFKGQPMKELINHGYRYVCLVKRINNKPVAKQVSVHRLIAIAFIPNPENKPQVNHINANRLDCRIENLEWCTPKENIRHSIDMGLKKFPKGEGAYSSKLTMSQAHKIREQYSLGEGNYKDLAKIYKVGADTIGRIIRGSTYIV